MNYKSHQEVAAIVAALVGQHLLKTHREAFRIEDLTSVQENDGAFARSEQSIQLTSFQIDEAEFNLLVKISKISGAYSERPLPYAMEVQVFHQVDVSTPKFVYAHQHYGIGQEQTQSDGAPGSIGQLVKFYFYPHPMSAGCIESITHEMEHVGAKATKEIMSVAKQLARAVIVHL